MMAALRRSARVKNTPLDIIKPQSNGIKKAASPKPSKANRKTDTAETSNGKGTFAIPALPTTPKKKRTSKAAAKAPPFTPTPSAVGLISAPLSASNVNDATSPSTDRPVEPHVTNAPLRTPGGSRVVAYPNGVDSSPSKTGLPRPSTTTGNVLEEACAHLIKTDPKLQPLIDKHHCRIFSPDGLAEEIDPFRALSSGIISQQVSGAAARSIKNKFIALFHEGDASEDMAFPTPEQVAKSKIETLRTAGLSGRKAEYIQGLAEKFVSGELSARMLVLASTDECLEKLIAVRGLGKWSVEMFLVFALKRLDILSTGDLGVQRGMAAYAGKDIAKLKAKGGGKWKYMSEQDMLDISEKFAPYRSIFMWYMWRIEEVDVDAMQN